MAQHKVRFSRTLSAERTTIAHLVPSPVNVSVGVITPPAGADPSNGNYVWVRGYDSNNLYLEWNGFRPGLTCVVQIEITGDASSLVESGGINVQKLGAVGDGVSDDTKILQRAFDLIGQGGPVYKCIIPDGTYLISSTLEILGNYGFEIFCSPRAIIKWNGDSSSTMLRLAGCYEAKITQLSLQATTAKPAYTALEFATAVGFTSGKMVLDRIVIDGSSEDNPGLTYGAHFNPSGGNANNDFSFWNRCIVRYTTSDNVLIEGSQSKSHTFVNCSFNVGTTGIHSFGSFRVSGGGYGSHSVTDFWQEGVDSVDHIEINGINGEESKGFLTVGALYPDTTTSASIVPVVLTNNRWASLPVIQAIESTDATSGPTYGTSFAANQIDGSLGTVSVSYPIWMNARGTLTMHGNIIQSGPDLGVRRLKIRCSGLGGAAISGTGNLIYNDNQDVVPIEWAHHDVVPLSFDINWQGNSVQKGFVTPGVTPSTWEADHNIDLIKPPAGAVKSIHQVHQHLGFQQSVSFSATPSFSPSSGETMRTVLTGNITGWTIASGSPGQNCTILFVQDGTGGRTLAGTPANVLLAGGALALSAGASKTDVLNLRWDSAASKWIETSRSLNC